MKAPILIGALLFLSACMASMPPKHSMVSSFDPSEVEWFSSSGANSVYGSALIRQRGGGVVTCAGQEVGLVPVSTYANERIRAIYGNLTNGYSRYGNSLIKEPPEQAYMDMSHTTICNAQGFFSFRNLPDGEFYVSTAIRWQVNDYSYEGGTLMRMVILSDGEAAEVVLSP